VDNYRSDRVEGMRPQWISGGLSSSKDYGFQCAFERANARLALLLVHYLAAVPAVIPAQGSHSAFKYSGLKD
jgi:hypothetical protein